MPTTARTSPAAPRATVVPRSAGTLAEGGGHDVPGHDVPGHDVPGHDVPGHDVPGPAAG
ncbi:hypothetical protein [Modestobacter sp. SYSU DS0875]